ncbi:MAG: NADH:ubiquinone reductase (Na(+)-transporting) subunit A, partial [Bacteroides cellulosilyticus]|nr:NADH:ubiquinone reductase (Na(+)-transporting) subunit A [Bacteroides cellulosilyticus]
MLNTITHLVIIVLVNERNYGNLSVIPFFFALYSRSFLLLLRQINETIILYKR